MKQKKAFLYRVLVRTPAFKQFFQNQRYRDDDFEKLSSEDKYRVLYDFFWEEAGEKEAQRIGLAALDYLPVKAVPHSKMIVKKGVADISPHLRNGQFLTLEIDLNFSETELVKHIKIYLKRYSKYVASTPKTRGISIGEDQELDKMFLAYDLIESGLSVEQAMHHIFPDTQGKKATSTDDKRKQLTRWYKKVADHISGNSRP
jgi:hypothetical protein